MKITQAEKDAAVRRVEAGETSALVASDLGVAPSTIRTWKQQIGGVQEASSTPDASFVEAEVVEQLEGLDAQLEVKQRCMNRECIIRFIPSSVSNWFHSPDCSKSKSRYTQAEIMREIAGLGAEASNDAVLRVAYAGLHAANRKLAKRDSFNQIFDECLRSFAELPNATYSPVAYPRSKGTSDHEMIIQLSDWQIGKRESGIGVDHMINVRIPRLHDAIMSILRARREGGDTINHVRIQLGGDMLEGCGIYKGQTVYGLDHTGDMHMLINQIELTARLIAETVLLVASEVPCVTVGSVRGNHGRIGKIGDADPRDNWDTHIAKIAELRCMNQDNVTWDIEGDNWWQSFESMGYNFVVIHGDQLGSFEALPNILKGWVAGNVFGVRPDVFLTHHFHTFRIADIEGMLAIQGGTIDGGSDYYTLRSGNKSDPKQVVIIMSERHGVEVVYPIHFDE